jgi:selenide,water dikinase
LLPPIEDKRLLLGVETRDDAGVFLIAKNLALVQTVDFFTPIVDDPYDFGQIAVTNSLSDIYAMGATPLTALNLVGFPIATLDKQILAQILKGGWDKAREAGVTILGGHSVKDPELKYGLAVTAITHPAKIIRNNTANIGDILILTKALGTGILTTALKNEKLPDDLLRLVTRTMKQLNKKASEIMQQYQVTSCTDITGFGFLGHLLEMVGHTGKSARIDTIKIPFLPEVPQLIEAKQIPGGLQENLKYLLPSLQLPTDLEEWRLPGLCDPQTSGGLLFTLPASQVENSLNHLHREGIMESAIVGEIIPQREKAIILE